MTSLADKIRGQLEAGKTPKEIAAMFGTSASYVRMVRQRTDADGLPKFTAGDLAWRVKQRHSTARKEYHRQYQRRRKAAAKGER